MAKHFRANYLKQLQAYFIQDKLQFHGQSKSYALTQAFNCLKETLWHKDWIVYAKQPFAGPKQIIQYLSNYTHRIALSNHRLIDCENNKVSFRWRDYTDENKTKVMTLSAEEFIRRYLQHVLPSRFTRIRQIGFLANRYKADKLNQCRTALEFELKPITEESTSEILLRVYHIDIHRYIHCHSGNKKTIVSFPNRYQRFQGYDTS